MVQIITSIINCFAALVVAYVAVFGIRSWRREFKGKRQIELAEEILTLFYEAKDAFSAIRSPLGWVNEGATRKPAEDETPEQKRARDMAFVVFERYEANKEIFNKLFALRYRFMALFGKDKVSPFDEIHKVRTRIFVASKRLADLWTLRSSTGDTVDEDKLYEKIHKYEAIFWEGDPDDEITELIEKIIKEIEHTCEQVIKSEEWPGFFCWLQRKLCKKDRSTA